MSASFDEMIDGVLSELVSEDAETTEELETDEVETDGEGAEPELEDAGDEDLVEESEKDDASGEDDDEGEEDNEAEAIVELDPEMTVRIDGKDVKVADALELKADYTRKTQALAEERKTFEVEREQVAESVQYLVEMEQMWNEQPENLLASFAAASEDAEELMAQTVVALARANAADGNLAVVKQIIALAADDLLDDDMAEQFGFTEDVISKIKRQVKTDERTVRLERKLSAEERRQSEAQRSQQSKQEFDGAVEEYKAELSSQWDRIVAVNPEVSAMSDVERGQLRVSLIEYARNNDGVPLNVAYDALEAHRMRGEGAKRAATAAARQKKASASRVTSRPSGTASKPAPRAKGDWDAAIAESVAELEARKARR